VTVIAEKKRNGYRRGDLHEKIKGPNRALSRQEGIIHLDRLDNDMYRGHVGDWGFEATSKLRPSVLKKKGKNFTGKGGKGVLGRKRARR